MDDGVRAPDSPRETPRRRGRRRLTALALAAALGAAQHAAPDAAATGPDPPAGFAEILSDPRIAGALVWDRDWSSGSGPRTYPDWDPRRRADLHRLLTATEPGEAIELPPFAAPAASRWVGGEAAWRAYLTHVAHALRLEAHRGVPWSLRSLTPDQLALLLDGRHLLHREREGVAAGPMGSLADLDPGRTLQILRKRGLVAASQEETVYAFADWIRREARSPDGEASPDCADLADAFASAMRSVNIPAQVATSRFARPGEPARLHSRVELPTLGRGLAHAADLLAPFAIPSGNAVPTTALFPTLGWIRDHVDHPRQLDCDGDVCNTAPEQALYNTVRRLLALAASHLPDGLLIDRATDPGASEPPDRLLETLSSGCPGFHRGGFARPLFEDAERREIARRADEEIERAGEGDWERGAETVRRRWEEALGKP